MSDDWDDIAAWWQDEAATDPSYPNDVDPLLTSLLPEGWVTAVDLGCGDGRAMAMLETVDTSVIGVDLSGALLASALRAGPVVRLRLPDLSSIRDDAFDLAYSVYLVDLIADDAAFFASCARIVRRGGHLVVVINHPVYTAPGAAPLMDEDGEVLWRWGGYLAAGSSEEPAGGRTVIYHHRPVGVLLSNAAASGWVLEEVAERGLSTETIAAVAGYDGQDAIPRLLGVRWRLAGPAGTPR